MTEEEKENCVSQALNSEEGEAAFREAFEPILTNGIKEHINKKRETLNDAEYINFAIDFMWAAGASKEQITEAVNQMKQI